MKLLDPQILHKLIWQHTCESIMSDAKFNQIKLIISAPLKLKYEYTSEMPIFLGWTIISYKKIESF